MNRLWRRFLSSPVVHAYVTEGSISTVFDEQCVVLGNKSDNEPETLNSSDAVRGSGG
jgi:hypothetical protein